VRLALLLLLAAGCAAPPGDGFVVPQKELGENACGPCAFYNCLLRGDGGLRRIAGRLPGAGDPEKIRHLYAVFRAT
jgi:hypothetical protein